MFYRLLRFFIVSLFAVLVTALLSACEKQEPAQDRTDDELILSTTAPTTTASTFEVETTESSVSSYIGQEIDAHIILDDGKTTINGNGVSFENGRVSINLPGTYYFGGTLSDGQIYVNTQDEEKKVHLIFGGVTVASSDDAPLYIENSPKETVIVLESGTVNTFSDEGRAISAEATDYATAAIYSKDDLQFEGDGKLIVNGNFNKGIFSKNDIQIRGGDITVNALDDAVRGKDGVEISAGTLNIICQGDGIRTSEELEDGKGDILISGGVINIDNALDGIQATGNLTISGGTLNIKSGGGATGNIQGDYFSNGNPFGNFGKNPANDSSSQEQSSETEKSVKALKSAKQLTISGGNFTLDAVDDTIHAPYVTISGGTFTMKSDDDGIHGDENVTISGGTVEITQSYEGVEGKVINIGGGELLINSADDGFNAASGSSSSAAYEQVPNWQAQEQNQSPEVSQMRFGGGMGGMDYDGSCVINMTDGYVLINAEGDGIDSNGSVNMTGGTMIVYGPTNGGNGALDYGGQFYVNGGTLLAVGSRGMAQSVTGSGVTVFNGNYNCQADTVSAIIASDGSTLIGFRCPKRYESLVFASDRIEQGKTYSFYTGGSFSGTQTAENGVCFDGTYTPGNLLGVLS